MGKLDDINEIVKEGNADAIAMAHVLHYGHYTVSEIRDYCIDEGLPVRKVCSTLNGVSQ